MCKNFILTLTLEASYKFKKCLFILLLLLFYELMWSLSRDFLHNICNIACYKHACYNVFFFFYIIIKQNNQLRLKRWFYKYIFIVNLQTFLECVQALLLSNFTFWMSFPHAEFTFKELLGSLCLLRLPD